MIPSDLATARARALGAPTRQRIVAFLADAKGPVTVAALTGHLGLNHNAVRRHLTQLVDVGLVVEEHETRSTPGRPRLLYRLAPGTPAADEASYERLAVMLADLLANGDDPQLVGRRAAARDDRSARAGVTPIEALTDRFDADGFAPVVRSRGARHEIVLERCPFAAAARVNPEAICRLHLGLAEGAVDTIGALHVEGLVAKDPRRAGCRLTVTETS